MSVSGVADAPARCPDRGTLAAFSLGKLPLPTLEAVAGHLSTCPGCNSALDELQHEGDSLLGRLGGCGEQDTLEGEDGCARLEERARALDFSQEATAEQSRTGPAGPPPEAPLPERVGPYVILGRIGRGGMGVVYKARQTPMNRLVALKMLSAGAHAGATALARFRVEAEAVARLKHANVIQIHDYGEHEGLPYFSMELAEGGSLAQRLRDGPLPVRQAAAMTVLLARAVQYAHERQVLHRDLKPANVLLDGDVPKVSDFGLAKLLDAESGQTVSEAVLGTPSYMAPEQAEGKTAAVGPPADVYALGAVLYAALTGQPPFRGRDNAQTVRMVRLVEPEPPSRRRREVPRDLEAVCLKCLEKEPARRYASAEALARDLERWLAGEPTLARPRRWPARAWRQVRRHPLVTVLTLALTAALAAAYWLAPEDPVAQMQRDLERGRPVTLIGEAGGPRWFREVWGDVKTKAAVSEEGTFSVHSWGTSLVELLPETKCDRYRLRGQIRQHLGNITSAAGLYFGYAAYPGPHSDVSVYACLNFSDAADARALWARSPLKRKLPEPKGNRVRIDLIGTGKAGPVGQTFGFTASCLGGAIFQPQPPHEHGSGPWRSFEVVVTPENIFAARDGESVGNLPVARLLHTLEANLARLRQGLPNEPLLQGIPAVFPTRGAIGLFTHQGGAHFRSVEITPLSEAP